MASGTWKWAGAALVSAFTKKIDTSADTFKAIPSTSTFTPDQDTIDFVNDITNLVTGTNVPSGGITLTGFAVTYTGATNVFKVDFDDISVNPATATGIRVLTVADTTPGTDATRPVIGFVIFDSDLSPNAAPLSITIDSAGAWTLTIAA